MIISCKCINVCLELGNTRPKGMSLSSLQLTAIEESHRFFSSGVAEVDNIVYITKQISILTTSAIVGNWIIETCINCAQPYYAKHKENKHLPLISAGLVADPNTLKNHLDYSPAFRIVVMPLTDKNITVDKISAQKILTELQQSLDITIKNQVEKTDENIRQYSEQQFEILAKFQNKAIQDHALLKKNIQAFECEETLVELIAPEKSQAKHNSSCSSTNLHSPKSRFSNGHPKTMAMPITGRPQAKRSNSLFSPREGAAASVDAEGVFNFEDMDDSPSENVASGDSDTDHDDSGSHDEGIDIHRKKENFNLARSLPVNVPAFAPGGLQLHPVEIHQDVMAPQHPEDIAASIKALARSVHGDAVFGDLPRPRFSTQI